MIFFVPKLRKPDCMKTEVMNLFWWFIFFSCLLFYLRVCCLCYSFSSALVPVFTKKKPFFSFDILLLLFTEAKVPEPGPILLIRTLKIPSYLLVDFFFDYFFLSHTDYGHFDISCFFFFYSIKQASSTPSFLVPNKFINYVFMIISNFKLFTSLISDF